MYSKMTQSERLAKLEDKVDNIDQRIMRMENKLDTLIAGLQGDGINRGFINDIRYISDHNTKRIENLESSQFTSEQKKKLIHMAGLFDGWKLVLAGILYILPIIMFVYKIFNP